MKKILSVFVNNFWTLMVLWGAFHMLGKHSYETGMLKLSVLVAFMCICLRNVKFVKIDIFVILFLFLSTISYGWYEYSDKSFLDAYTNQIFPLSMFYIARSKWFGSNGFLKGMYYPLLFAFVAALVLFFISPSWYIAYKTSGWSYEYSGDNYYEHMRLSGFWPWSYFIGYSSLFFLMYEICKKHLYEVESKLYYPSVFIAVLTLLLAQQRVSIMYFIVFLLLLKLLKSRWRLVISTKKMSVLMGVILGIVVIFFVVYPHIDSSYVDYILNRSVKSDSNLVSDRLGLYVNFLSDISIFGNGLGAHSHTMRSLNPKGCITDCDYMRILCEFGVVGFLLLLCIFGYSLKIGCKNYKDLFFEYNVVFFLLIAMICATPLEHLPLHPYIYWYCLGRIVYKNRKEYL